MGLRANRSNNRCSRTDLDIVVLCQKNKTFNQQTQGPLRPNIAENVLQTVTIGFMGFLLRRAV